MPSLRTLIFTACLYVSLVAVMVAFSPVLFMRRASLMAVVHGWSRYFVWLCRVVGGMRMEVRGREKIPAGPLLVAAKHQSIWETFALIALFDDPCFILKRELMRIPLFGWYASRARMLLPSSGPKEIPVISNRSRSWAAIRPAIRLAVACSQKSDDR